MGRMSAEAMAGSTDMDTALRWHLTHNHYPSIPLFMIDTAKEAIDAANDGNWEELIDLPSFVEFRGGTQAPAHEIVDYMHLEPWIDREEGSL